MNDTARHMQESRQQLERDTSALVEAAQALLRHAVHDAGQGYAEARHRLADRIDAAQMRLAAMGSSVRDSAASGSSAALGYAGKHPWQLVGVGLGLGLLLALCFRAAHKE